MYMDVAVPDDCFVLAQKLKQTDKYELAVTGKEPLWVLLYPFRINRPNVHTFSVYKDNDEVVAMFGCCGEKGNPQRGTAWWLSSTEPFDSFKFMKHQKKYPK